MEIKKIGKEKLILLVLAGIMLIGASYFENGRSEGQTKIRETEYIGASLEDDYGKIMEEKISNMIEGIKGVSKASVMVTLKSGNEKVVKEDTRLLDVGTGSGILGITALKLGAKEVKGTDGKIYFDPDGILATAWELPGANNNFTVIFINKNQVIEFYKAGQLTPEEQEQVIALVRKYSN